MTTCCCSLAGTMACVTCPQRREMVTDWTSPLKYTFAPWWVPGFPEQPAPAPKKTIIEEYEDGKLVRRTITTQE